MLEESMYLYKYALPLSSHGNHAGVFALADRLGKREDPLRLVSPLPLESHTGEVLVFGSRRDNEDLTCFERLFLSWKINLLLSFQPRCMQCLYNCLPHWCSSKTRMCRFFCIYMYKCIFNIPACMLFFCLPPSSPPSLSRPALVRG